MNVKFVRLCLREEKVRQIDFFKKCCQFADVDLPIATPTLLVLIITLVAWKEFGVDKTKALHDVTCGGSLVVSVLPGDHEAICQTHWACEAFEDCALASPHTDCVYSRTLETQCNPPPARARAPAACPNLWNQMYLLDSRQKYIFHQFNAEILNLDLIIKAPTYVHFIQVQNNCWIPDGFLPNSQLLHFIFFFVKSVFFLVKALTSLFM